MIHICKVEEIKVSFLGLHLQIYIKDCKIQRSKI